MAYTNLINDIKQAIYNNGEELITGKVLQDVLVEMVNNLGSGYTYKGVATLSTNPDTTTPNIFYLLGEVGTYTNIGGIQHTSGIGIALWNGTAWSYQNVPSSAVVATDATLISGSTNPVQGGAVDAVINGEKVYVDLSPTIYPNVYNNGNLNTIKVPPTAANAGGAAVVLENVAGKKYKVFGNGGTAAVCLIIWADSTKAKIDKVVGNYRTNGIEVTAPNNAYYMAVNFNSYDSTTDKIQEYVQQKGIADEIADIKADLSQLDEDIDSVAESISKTNNDSLLLKSYNLFDGELLNGVWNVGVWTSSAIYRTIAHAVPIALNQKIAWCRTDAEGNRTNITSIIQEFSDESGETPIIPSANITGNSYTCTNSAVKSIAISFRIDQIPIVPETMELTIYDADSDLVRAFKPHNTSSYPIYVPFGYFNRIDSQKNSVLGSLYGKTIVCFGDSITQIGFYPYYASLLAGGTFINCGVGGTWLTQRTDDYAPFSGVALADAIASGDWSAQETAVETLTSLAYVVERMTSTDFDKVDIITFSFGSNDWNNTDHAEGSSSIDNFDKTTFRGAINYICKTILSAHPQVKLRFLAPMYRVFPKGHGVSMTIEEYNATTYQTTGFIDSDTWVNDANLTLKQVVAAIDEQAKINHCNVLNMYDNFGVDRYNYIHWLYDGTHLTNDGYREFGHRLAGFLTTE